MALSKNDVTVLKGISILIMVFLHTFLHKSDVDLCTHFIRISGKPLVNYLDRYAEICVTLYLFLGGYGLYLRHMQGPMKNGRRIFLLFLNYWIVLLTFLFVGSFISPTRYPGSWQTFLMNFTALSYSYNETWWFLMPYILLILVSGLLFNIVYKYSGWGVFAISYLICIGTSYTISRYGDKYLYFQLYYIPFLSFHLINGFLTGAIFAKYDLFDYMTRQVCTWKVNNNLMLFLLIMFSALIKICLRTSIINIFIVIILFSCVMNMRRNAKVDKLLLALGKESTNMWYIHAFFCFYLFHDFVYSLKYPLVIFVFVVLVSYISARFISLVYSPCRNLIIRQFN